jgi:hypothetical protein
VPEWATKDTDLQGFLDGSDGTRTRDLRRDRPVRAQPVQPATTPDYLIEQAFLTERTGCDRLRPASTRQSLCSRCVVALFATRTTMADLRWGQLDPAEARTERDSARASRHHTSSYACNATNSTSAATKRPRLSVSRRANRVRIAEYVRR